MRFTHIDVNFDITYDGDQKPSKCAKKVFFEQFWWPSYLTSKLMSLCVNLIMWIYFFLWTSSIVCVFWLFWHFDIFFGHFWHLIDIFDILTSFNLNHLSLSQGYFLFVCEHGLLDFPGRGHWLQLYFFSGVNIFHMFHQNYYLYCWCCS